ncbi:MAG: peptidoglycan-binding protein LysM [Flavobacteriaceae bacterium]|nr:peptidoglycan-binding protein LysM [Flavobacteriaceae bacterium]
MKKRQILLIVFPIALLSISWGFLSKSTIDFSHYSTYGLDLYYDVPDESSIFIEDDEFIAYPLLGKTFMGFREALAFKESRGDYTIINDFGYMGKYQFGRATLRMIGINDTDLFLSNPILQESAFKAYAARNKWVLRRDIQRYSGKYVNGVFITESGILAAAHLAGPGNVKKFLRSGGTDVFEDAFGTSVRYYLRKFSGYDTSHIVPNQNAKVVFKG